jgi:hypothetical protein
MGEKTFTFLLQTLSMYDYALVTIVFGGSENTTHPPNSSDGASRRHSSSKLALLYK